MHKQLPFGLLAIDTLTKFQGSIVERTHYMDGTIQYRLQPDALGSVEIPDSAWFDSARVKLVGDEAAPGNYV